MESNPSLKTKDLSIGQGLGYCPASADLSAAHKRRINCIRKKAVRNTDGLLQGYLSLVHMEKIADDIDEKDKEMEDSENISREYTKIGRPYMRKYAITSDSVYQLIMTPLMSSVLAKSDYLEVDTTYNENTDLPFLLNVTAFDYNVMQWMAVARVRSNKENANFYATAFKEIFSQCEQDNKEFKVEALKGIVLDWSDTERKGLETAIGLEIAERLMIRCLVHFGRSYQRVAERVSMSLTGELAKICNNSFCTIARAIPSAKSRSDVTKLFHALKGDASLLTIKCIIPHLSEDALLHENAIKLAWKKAQHRVEWWTRLPHLKMLSKVFSIDSDCWSGGPRDTNGVERVNQESKNGKASCLLKAMKNLYTKDKRVAISYLASEINISLCYRKKSDEARRQLQHPENGSVCRVHAATKTIYLGLLTRKCTSAIIMPLLKVTRLANE